MKAIMRDEREMKDSRIEWIGKIPASWNIERMKNQFVYTKGLNITKADLVDEGVAVISYGQIHAKNNTGTTLNPEFLRYISPDNIAINDKSLLNMGDIVFADTSEDYDGLGNAVYMDSDTETYAGYHTIIARLKNIDYSKYFAYLFKSDAWREQLRIRASGIKVFSVTQRMLNDVTLIMPGKNAIRPIISYLDDRCSKIDTIIAEAKASIEEYQELKQAVIYEAVTKGINHTQCKHIDIDYLDDMPVNWHISSIGLLFQFIGGYAYKSDRFIVDSNFQVIRIGNVKDNNLVLERNPVFISAEYATESNNAQIQVDDILFTMTGTKGKGDYFYTLIIKENDLVNKKLFVNQRVGCFRKSNSNIYMAYYNYLLKMPKIREYVFLFETGTANQGNIGIEVLNRIKLYCPPYDEQVKIVDYLDNKTERIDNLISEKQSLIEDLESYKKSLIYEVVTGKRKVVA